jgi:Arc/MetJ-type ribon-helix-helix transcriptional regulator
MKLKKTISIDKELLDWLEQKIQEKEFGSLSHGIEKALTELRKKYHD